MQCIDITLTHCIDATKKLKSVALFKKFSIKVGVLENFSCYMYIIIVSFTAYATVVQDSQVRM